MSGSSDARDRSSRPARRASRDEARQGFTLGDALATARLRGPAWAPIVEESRRTTVAQLDEVATSIAADLHRHGLRTGDRVAIAVRNSAPHIAASFGVWRSGATLVPLNPRLTPGEADALIAHARVGAVLTIDERSGEHRIEPCAAPASAAAASAAADDLLGVESPAVIAYTSGTTGRPKGVVLTHANMLWAAAAVMQTRRDSARAVAAVVSPLCHNPIFVSHYLARLMSGGTVVLGAFDRDRMIWALGDQGVTDLPLVPAMVAPVLESAPPAAIERLVKITVGSALTPMEVKRALADRFPNAEILEAYGQTESTDGVTMSVGREALERPGTVGRAHAIFALAIASTDGASTAPDIAGEILVRGPTVMRGYLDDAAATEATLRDGWLHTGDLGRLDGDGHLYITGRLKEIIISGGENVSPEEVEAVLARHPAVAEVAVFGTSHPRWGEQVTAAVVAKGPVTQSELAEFARPHLAGFKLPRALVIVDELPKTSSGKVKRSELREAQSSAPAPRSR